MHVCLSICVLCAMHVCVHVCSCVCMCVCVHMCACMCFRVCMCVCVCALMCMCPAIGTCYVHVYVRMCIYIIYVVYVQCVCKGQGATPESGKSSQGQQLLCRVLSHCNGSPSLHTLVYCQILRQVSWIKSNQIFK